MAERKAWEQSWTFPERHVVPSLPTQKKWPPHPGGTESSPKRESRTAEAMPGRDRVFEEVDFEAPGAARALWSSLLSVSRPSPFTRHGSAVSACLSECTLIDCDFANAVLICADLRQSTFVACRFTDAQLIGAELRGATLDHCDFTGANLTGDPSRPQAQGLPGTE